MMRRTCILIALLALPLCAEDVILTRPAYEKDAKHAANKSGFLFDAKNPPTETPGRLLSSELSAPFVALANGDVLPGRLIGANPADPSSPWPAHFVVVPRPPLAAFIAGDHRVRVHQDRVTRIVFRESTDRLLSPGDVRFTDGRVVRLKSVRWRESGLRALTEEGLVTATWSELSEIRLPEPAIRAAVLDDLRLPEIPAPQPRICRLETAGGATLTFWDGQAVSDKNQRGVYCHIVQPAWAVSAIRVPLNRIVTSSFRPANAIPLSSLPATALAERNLTGYHWPWTRNRNLRGGALASAAQSADFGVGTHAYSEIAFELPSLATRFKGMVGLDRIVGNGGCCELRIFRDTVSGKPAWESGVRTGGQDPLRFDLALSGTKRVILQTDFADKNRPKGADPLDIRDEASWLHPIVIADSAKLQTPPDLVRYFPFMSKWTLAEPAAEKIGMRHRFASRLGAWQAALLLPHGNTKDPIMRFTRELRVSIRNAHLMIGVGRDDQRINGHSVAIQVNGDRLSNTTDSNRGLGHVERRAWSLAPYIGQTVTLEALVTPTKTGETSGLIISQLSVSPLVEGLKRGKHLVPDLPLATIPAAVVHLHGGGELANGQITMGNEHKPLAFRGISYSHGYGMKGGSRLVYDLHPSWLRFVAIGGMIDSWSDVQYELYVDDQKKPFWSSDKMGPSDPGLQMDIAIPPGHRRISISLKGSQYAGLIHAGFMTDGTPYVSPKGTPSAVSQARITASSSSRDSEGEGPPEAIIDGKPGTRWSSIYADNQELILDLGEPQAIRKVTLLWEVAAAKRYTIAVSDDQKTWHHIHRAKDGIQGPRTDTVSVDPVTSRFLKVDLQERATEYGFSLYEIQIE
jgi:hypothetical protein